MKRLVACLAAGLALLAAFGPPRSASRPDVVLILIDTLRRDHLPFHGYRRNTAPFLAHLGARGAILENAYSTSAWTAPATASLHTSLYPFQHGVVTGRKAVSDLQAGGAALQLNRIPRSAETIAEAMSQAGYAAWALTENGNVSADMGFEQGFSRFFPLHPAHTADVITRRLEELRPEILARRPYFLYLHYMDVHGPYKRRAPFPAKDPSPEARRLASYDNAIVYVDSHIQQVYRRFGWDKNTIVIFTADHGEELGDHGNWGHAHNLYAETLNVPLVVVGLPGVTPGRRVYERVSHVDVLPTLRGVAGGRGVSGDSGTSLLPLLRGERSRLPPRALYADLWRSPGGQRKAYLQATLFGSWKFIQGMEEGPLLFNLDADPLDLDNKFSAYPQLGAELRQRFVDFEAASRRLEPEFQETLQDEAMNEELRALGYVN